MTRISLVSLALMAATASTAHADPAAELAGAIATYGKQVEYFQDYWSKALDDRWPIGGCHAAIKTAQDADVTATDEQKQTCAEFMKHHQLAEAEVAVKDANQWNFFLTHINMATNHEANGAKMVAAAAKCSAELDRLIAAGMPTNITVHISGSNPTDITMGEAKAKICAPLAKVGGTFAKDVGSARTKAYEAAAKPYKAAGIGGDRLELLVDHVSYAMYGTGGGELRTPNQLKSAKVIFELLGPNTASGLYTMRRYQFQGDKLVSTTSADFIGRPRAKFYR